MRSSYRATAGQVEVPTFLEVVQGGKYTDKYVPASCAHAYSLPPRHATRILRSCQADQCRSHPLPNPRAG